MRLERMEGDRYLPLRHPQSSKSFSTNSTAPSEHLQILSNEPQRYLSFTRPKNHLSSDLDTTSFTFAKEYQAINQQAQLAKQCHKKKIKTVNPEKIIEAPGLIDNYYYSALDASENGLVVMGLYDGCYAYNKQICLEFKGSHSTLLQDQAFSCLKLIQKGAILLAGKTSGQVSVFDVQKLGKIRSIKNHTSRVGCIERTESWGFLSGSRDQQIVHNDLRVQNSAVLKVLAHKQEVCGISRQQQSSVIASSDNNGVINIWDVRNRQYFRSHFLFEKTAVKALQWCPWKIGLLAAGGGSKDHQIIFWNNQEEKVTKKLNGNSQVTGLKWRQIGQNRDIVTIHGNGLGIVWNSEDWSRRQIWNRHQGRILDLAQEGEKGMWTIGADRTLRLWKTSEKLKKKNKAKRSGNMDDFVMK